MPLRLLVAHRVAGPLADRFPFPLRDGHHDVEHEPAAVLASSDSLTLTGATSRRSNCSSKSARSRTLRVRRSCLATIRRAVTSYAAHVADAMKTGGHIRGHSDQNRRAF